MSAAHMQQRASSHTSSHSQEQRISQEQDLTPEERMDLVMAGQYTAPHFNVQYGAVMTRSVFSKFLTIDTP